MADGIGAQERLRHTRPPAAVVRFPGSFNRAAGWTAETEALRGLGHAASLAAPGAGPSPFRRWPLGRLHYTSLSPETLREGLERLPRLNIKDVGFFFDLPLRSAPKNLLAAFLYVSDPRLPGSSTGVCQEYGFESGY